jgi:hypothetical protein
LNALLPVIKNLLSQHPKSEIDFITGNKNIVGQPKVEEVKLLGEIKEVENLPEIFVPELPAVITKKLPNIVAKKDDQDMALWIYILLSFLITIFVFGGIYLNNRNIEMQQEILQVDNDL